MTMTAEELVKAVCPKIRDNGWAYYFVPETIARGAKMGIDVLTFYVLGRGGVLGDVDWQVVHSAFGYFNPDLIRDAWNSGREKVSPPDAGRAHLECCHALGRAKLAGVEGLEAFCEAAGAVNDAAKTRLEALSLYSAYAARPLPDDAPARAMQLVSVLREFRGSAHLVAVVASGLTAKQAHYISRPAMMQMFGWSEGDVPEVGDEHRRRAEAAEALTDELVLPAYSVLDGTGGASLLTGMEAIERALAA